MFVCGPTCPRFESALHHNTDHLDFPPVVHDWVIKGLGMPRRVCATEHIKDPVALMEKSTESCPGGSKVSS